MEKVEERAEKDASEVAKEEATVEDAVKISSWRVPNTEITIARIEKGDRTGEYLFTIDTVARAKEFYETARSLSYKPDAAFGIYQTYIHAPGSWLDPDWINALPYWVKLVYHDVPIWKWIGSVLSILLGVSVIVLLIPTVLDMDLFHGRGPREIHHRGPRIMTGAIRLWCAAPPNQLLGREPLLPGGEFFPGETGQYQ